MIHDLKLMDCYTEAFEMSIFLDARHMSKGDLTAVGSVFGSRSESFSSKSTDKFGEA
ncbi:unnamed protein product [Dovyalis caffra]|uniref:Uncharacterized protein n=1 Tax=Dovyalis caffra TaxID=77055 RepID=A0AAV1RME0_9ROSI|nr:unnamed protein product [Dovyalis caffra]